MKKRIRSRISKAAEDTHEMMEQARPSLQRRTERLTERRTVERAPILSSAG